MFLEVDERSQNICTKFHCNSKVGTEHLYEGIRYGELFTWFHSLCSLACKSDDTYLKVKENIVKTSKDPNNMIFVHKATNRPNEWDQSFQLSRINLV